MKAEVDIKPFLKAMRDFRIAEQQPCGVQVVEGIGLVGSGFQFFTRLAAVFAEEFDDFVKPISLFHLLNPVVLLFETTSL